MVHIVGGFGRRRGMEKLWVMRKTDQGIVGGGCDVEWISKHMWKQAMSNLDIGRKVGIKEKKGDNPSQIYLVPFIHRVILDSHDSLDNLFQSQFP